MLVGVGLTLSAVAIITVLARNWIVTLLANHGARMDQIARALDGLAGICLIAIAGWALLR
jgi:nickel/cobalt transporter (NicO) family protein